MLQNKHVEPNHVKQLHQGQRVSWECLILKYRNKIIIQRTVFPFEHFWTDKVFIPDQSRGHTKPILQNSMYYLMTVWKPKAVYRASKQCETRLNARLQWVGLALECTEETGDIYGSRLHSAGHHLEECVEESRNVVLQNVGKVSGRETRFVFPNCGWTQWLWYTSYPAPCSTVPSSHRARMQTKLLTVFAFQVCPKSHSLGNYCCGL